MSPSSMRLRYCQGPGAQVEHKLYLQLYYLSRSCICLAMQDPPSMVKAGCPKDCSFPHWTKPKSLTMILHLLQQLLQFLVRLWCSLAD